MSKKKTAINPICAKRLNLIIDSSGMSKKDFADKVGITPNQIAYIVNLKRPLTIETAQMIVTAFPEYRLDWLLGKSEFENYYSEFDFLTGNDVETQECAEKLLNHSAQILDSIGYDTSKYKDMLQKKDFFLSATIDDIKTAESIKLEKIVDGQNYYFEYKKMVDEIIQYATFLIKNYSIRKASPEYNDQVQLIRNSKL